MKKVFLSLLFIGSISVVNAQTKVGYVNIKDITKSMKEISDADSILKKTFESYKSDLLNLNSEFENDLKSFIKDSSTLSSTMKQFKKDALIKKKENVSSFEKVANEEIDKKRQELYYPILKRINKAVEDVAKEKGYDYIIDNSVIPFLYANDKNDLLNAIKKKLNLK